MNLQSKHFLRYLFTLSLLLTGCTEGAGNAHENKRSSTLTETEEVSSAQSEAIDEQATNPVPNEDRTVESATTVSIAPGASAKVTTTNGSVLVSALAASTISSISLSPGTKAAPLGSKAVGSPLSVTVTPSGDKDTSVSQTGFQVLVNLAEDIDDLDNISVLITRNPSTDNEVTYILHKSLTLDNLKPGANAVLFTSLETHAEYQVLQPDDKASFDKRYEVYPPSLNPVVTAISHDGKTLTATGVNLGYVQSIAEDEEEVAYSLTSIQDTTLMGDALSSFSYVVGTAYNFLFATAYGQTSITATFSITNGSITSNMLNTSYLPLTGGELNSGASLATDQIKSRSGSALLLSDDSGSGLTIADGGAVSTSGNLTVTGNLATGGTLTTTGDLTTNGNLIATGNMTTNGTLTASGNVAATGNVTATGNVSATGMVSGVNIPVPSRINDLRLSLHATEPFVSSVTSSNTIYWHPFRGNQVSLYNGTDSRWELHTIGSVLQVACPGTASSLFDIFVYNNAGTVTLETTQWSDSTAGSSSRSPNFDLVRQDGILVKSGSPDKRFIGTLMTTSTPDCKDTDQHRYLWNNDNQMDRSALVVSYSSHTYTTSTWRAWSNDLASHSVEIVLGQTQVVNIGAIFNINASNHCCSAAGAVGVNSPTSAWLFYFTGSYDIQEGGASAPRHLNPGFNYIVGLQLGAAGTDFQRLTVSGHFSN